MEVAPRSVFAVVILTAFVLSLAAAPAFGQPSKEEPSPPFDVTGLEAGGGWVPWVVAFLFVAVAIGVALKNPHRQTTERA